MNCFPRLWLAIVGTKWCIFVSGLHKKKNLWLSRTNFRSQSNFRYSTFWNPIGSKIFHTKKNQFRWYFAFLLPPIVSYVYVKHKYFYLIIHKIYVVFRLFYKTNKIYTLIVICFTVSNELLIFTSRVPSKLSQFHLS